jgi:cytoskeleton-associated protein 5
VFICYRLSDFEAKLILPVLVEKAGHNQDKIKADHRELLRRAALVYPPVRVAAFIKVHPAWPAAG